MDNMKEYRLYPNGTTVEEDLEDGEVVSAVMANRKSLDTAIFVAITHAIQAIGRVCKTWPGSPPVAWK